MTIGVGVEGPSDRAFWDKVLHKYFRQVKFDIRNMKNRDKLIRETPNLLETFRGSHYHAGFILIDRDKTPCVTKVFKEFDQQIQKEARKPLDQRFLFVCVAIRELEAWFLADSKAIASVLPGTSYKIIGERAAFNGEKNLLDLWRQTYGYNTTFNKIDFAKNIALPFDPHSALKYSASFKYFWDKMTLKCR